ncbi:hypothetical protein F5B17DRAFT_445051 [Nemania serpens]|nr:hypothetical protein F5B17DRAFT_445051 [Nemania serpens]
MDGSNSRFPSTSVASSSYHEPGTPFFVTPRQSLRELYSSVTSMPNIGMDPPRPAREGCEWVWFPAGYWAEREIAETPTAKDSIRVFRWRKRSGKSASESPKNSPGTRLTNPSPAEKTDKAVDHPARRRSLTRTASSSESAGSFFPQNRTPLPSPYLTEEAHVQSLQWPSIDAAARTSSTGGGSVLRSRAALSPSPLHLSSAEDEMETDMSISSLVSRRAFADTSSDIMDTALPVPSVADDRAVKLKRTFVNWWMLSEHRQRVKKSRSSSDEQTKGDAVRMQPSGPQDKAASPSRKQSSVSDKSHKSLKSRSTRLLAKARWHRKTSASSGASSSSQPHDSAPSQHLAPYPIPERGGTPVPTNSWGSEYPGGEAIRVQTPRIIQSSLDAFPRSFFSDLTPPSSTSPCSRSRSRSRQEGQANPKNKVTTLSKSFSPGDSNSTASSSTPRQRGAAAARTSYLYLDEEDDDDASDRSVIRDGRDSGTPTPKPTPTPTPTPLLRMPTCKEWWEVSVPRSFGEVDSSSASGSRRAFRFDLPEHLPSSPMCPANKRHKSGGTGVCVYHGRAKGVRKEVKGRAGGEEDEDEEEDEDTDTDGAASDVWK